MILAQDHRYGFGTVATFYTVAELQDLCAAKDAEMRNLSRQLNEIAGMPFDLTTFSTAYQTLVARYGVARTTAQKAIDSAVGSWRSTNMIVADSEYKGLLAAVNPRWQEHTWAPGDGSIEDLSDRLAKMGATGKGAEPIPQPSKGSDVDITVYQKLPDVTKAPGYLAKLFDTKHLIIYAVVAGALVVFVLPKVFAMTPQGMMARRMMGRF